VPGGQIIIACSGDSIANASASLKIDSGYALTVKSHTDPAVDVVFSKDDQSSEYVYKCRAGEPLGGIVEQP
jgi:hypothetical protein